MLEINQEKGAITIIGAGLAGVSLACALPKSDYTVTLLDSTPEPNIDPNDPNARSIALSYRSHKIFSNWGAWDQLAAPSTAIKKIHVSDRGHFGTTKINSEDLGVDALGYSIQAQQIYSVLKGDSLLIRPAYITHLDDLSGEITYEHNGQTHTLSSDLIIIADGGSKNLNNIFSVGRDEKEYEQTAIVVNVTLSKPHQHIAYERFTTEGPIALLPIEKNNMALVWTINTHQLNDYLQLDDATFLNKLQTAFGYRAGSFLKISARSTYPLKQSIAHQPIKNKVLLLGNAAHTLHPVAAQGFNLTLRDIDCLVTQLKTNSIETALQHYLEKRQAHQIQTARFTHSLINIFSNDIFPVAPLRSLGLAVLNNCRPLKNYLAKKVMGYY